DTQGKLINQMNVSIDEGPEFINRQNHGRITGNIQEDEDEDDYANDTVLERAVTLLREEPSFENMIKKFHRDVNETQKMASEELRSQKAR
ncbi:MAG: hypothetical protein VCC01_07985, partial [Candidatus Hydrogenedentota bacterium]